MSDKATMTAALRETVQLAVRTAAERHHEFILLEHLLYALLYEPDARDAIQACGGSIRDLCEMLEEFFDEHVEPLDESEGLREPTASLAVARVLNLASLHVTSCEKLSMDSLDVLIAMFAEEHSHAVYYLTQQGVTRLSLVEYVSHGLPDADPFDGDFGDDTENWGDEEWDEFDGGEQHERRRGNPLADFTVNLNEMARLGRIDPLIGREPELQRLMRTLCRRNKNNPLLVGEPGVGKTAIVEGLALRILAGRVPDALEGAVIHALDMGSVLAGTRFRGQFEERIKAVLKALADKPEAILFIDEFHTVIGAGATSGGSMDAANLFKPALASGALRCIGASTFNEYKNHVQKDHALARRFLKIDVGEPTVADTISILKGLRARYEEHHGIRYRPSALEAAARLSERYLNDRFLPDKAIDVIDEAGAEQALLPLASRKKTIGVRDIETVIAEMARIPAKEISASDKTKLKHLAEELRDAVFGQDSAVDTVAQAIKLSRAGLNHPDRPIGSFLFAGPTGVGKTELSRQLALALGVKLIRFDMSEYSEKHSVARLIGAPPGYVGFDQGGLMTDAVIKAPHAVLLLDEIEKAHLEIFNVLLQIMDHGTLTDNNGREADFRNIVLIMTSNVGAKELAANRVGFGTSLEPPVSSERAVERFFLPEFRNRLDAIVHFDPLDLPLIERIVTKFIGELQDRLSDRKVTLNVTPAARRWLAETGYDPKLGARPIARLVQKEIQEKLVDDILFGPLAAGGTATVDLSDNQLTIDVHRE